VAVFYTLVVVGDTSPEDMAGRLRLDREGTRELGFSITLHRSTNGYFASDGWELKPKRYLSVGFRADKDRDPRELATNLITLVDRAFETGSEDMALIQLGEVLLLERAGGTVRQHPAGFWNNVV
jgi:hypothetical protein